MPEQVLLIDDDPRIVGILKIRLEAAGYQVHTAYRGDDGVALAQRVRPQAIVLDVSMPGMDGLEVCRQLRADAKLRDTPIVVVSAITHDSARQAVFEAGGNEFLGKPFQSSQVCAVVRAAIDSQAVLLAEGGV